MKPYCDPASIVVKDAGEFFLVVANCAFYPYVKNELDKLAV